jgi:osmoprotectant transport system substrate-binding protein
MRRPDMRMNRLFALAAAMVVVLAACSSSGTTPAPSAASAAPSAAASEAASAAPSSAAPSEAAKAEVRIGSDNFYESKLMAELYAQALEHAGYTVTRQFGLGSRQTRVPIFTKGLVDLVPEYVGSGLGYYDKTLVTGDGEANRTALQAQYDKADNLATVLAIAPGQDTNAAVVRQDTAASLNLTKMSDLAAVQDKLKWGLPPDCDKNPLCKDALESYGIKYPPKVRRALAACDAPIAQALQGKAIDFAWLCSTQPAIAQFGFKVLDDDKKTQPAENLAPVVRNDYLAKVDKAAFSAVLDAVSAKMTTDELTKLGVKVGVDNEDLEDVAKQWLTDNGLLS